MISHGVITEKWIEISNATLNVVDEYRYLASMFRYRMPKRWHLTGRGERTIIQLRSDLESEMYGDGVGDLDVFYPGVSVGARSYPWALPLPLQR